MGKIGSVVARPIAPIQGMSNLQPGIGLANQFKGEAEKFMGVGKPYSPNASAFAPNGQEQEYITKLQQMAYGQTPSPAELQMRQGMDQAVNQAGALGASARGINPALAARLTQLSQAKMTQGLNQDAGILRAQEQQGAMGMLGNELQSVRTGQMGNEQIRANAYENSATRRANLAGGLMSGGANMAMMAGGGGKAHGGMIGYAGGGMTMHADSEGGFEEGSNPYQAPVTASPSAKKSGGGFKPNVQMPLSNVIPTPQMPNIMTMQMPQSEIGMKLHGLAHGGQPPVNAMPGGRVPGEPRVDGDHPMNDTVPAMLSPGEIVIPNSILDHEHAGEMAKAFVQGILSSKKKDSFNEGGVSRYIGKAVGQSLNDTANAVKTVGGGLYNAIATPVSGFMSGVDETIGGPNNPPLPPETQMQMPQELPHHPDYMVGPATPPQAKAPMSAMDQLSQTYGGMGGGPMAGLKSAMGREADIQTALGDRAANIHGQLQQDLQMKNAELTNLKANYDMDVEKFLADDKDGKINPSQYLDNMSTGQKVMTAIGLIMGGMGSGLTGRPDTAMKFLNDQIDRDIMGQKENMAKKQNLYRAMREKYQDDVTATEMSKAYMLGLAQNRVQMEMDKASGPQARARGEQLIAQLQMQQQQHAQAGLTKKMEQMTDKYVPGVGMALTNEGAKGVREMKASVDTVKDTVSRLRQITSQTGKSFSPDLRAEADSLRNMLVGALRVPITGPGSMSEGDRELLMRVVPDVTSFSSLDSRTLKRLDTIIEKMDSTYNRMLEANGLQGVRTEAGGSGQTKIDMRTGITYKRGPNGEAIPVSNGR